MRRLLGILAMCSIGFTGSASAQTPVAVVEDVRGKVAGVEFMDYVAPGKVIQLGANSAVVLSYMKSCRRETISGIGTVIVGKEQSMVHLGDVVSAKVECDSSNMQLTEREVSESAATVVRSMSRRPPDAGKGMRLTLFGASPVVETNGRGTLTVDHLDATGEHYEVDLAATPLLRGKFYDFARSGAALTPGATYVARLGAQRTVFMIDQQAKSGAGPIIGRLVRVN